LALVACSPREDPEARKQPLSLDKVQIDVAESDKYLNYAVPGTQTRLFVLTNMASQDDEARWQRVKALTRRPVQIKDGNEVLATGQIASLTSIRGEWKGEKEGLDIDFQSPEVLETLERKLGFKRRDALAEACTVNLKRIATAARAWAQSHNELLPPDFLAMKEELGSPTVLVCPLDVGKIDKKVWVWSQLNTNHLTYRIVSPGASGKDPTRIYARCPIHGLAARADGSVRKPDIQ
jgi:hypothetical protein